MSMGAAQKRSAFDALLDLPSGTLTVRQLADLIREVNSEERAKTLATEKPAAEYIRTRDAAKLLDCSMREVQQLALDGKLAHGRVGRELRFRRVDLEAYVKKAAG